MRKVKEAKTATKPARQIETNWKETKGDKEPGKRTDPPKLGDKRRNTRAERGGHTHQSQETNIGRFRTKGGKRRQKPIYLSICLAGCLSVYLSFYLSIVYLSLSVCLSLCLFVCLSVCLSICRSVYRSCTSVCIYVCTWHESTSMMYECERLCMCASIVCVKVYLPVCGGECVLFCGVCVAAKMCSSVYTCVCVWTNDTLANGSILHSHAFTVRFRVTFPNSRSF